VSTHLELQPRSLIRAGNFISGRWVASVDGQHFAVADPATGTVIAIHYRCQGGLA